MGARSHVRDVGSATVFLSAAEAAAPLLADHARERAFAPRRQPNGSEGRSAGARLLMYACFRSCGLRADTFLLSLPHRLARGLQFSMVSMLSRFVGAFLLSSAPDGKRAFYQALGTEREVFEVSAVSGGDERGDFNERCSYRERGSFPPRPSREVAGNC